MTRLAKQPEEKVIHRPSAFAKPWDEMEQMFGRMFEDFWRRPHFGMMPEVGFGKGPLAMPAVDVYEEKDTVVITAELPGLKKDEIEVNLTNSGLTIRGEKKEQEEVRERGYYRSERSHGLISRTIEVPADVNAAKARATFTNGVLEVRLPKVERAGSNTKKVQIE